MIQTIIGAILGLIVLLCIVLGVAVMAGINDGHNRSVIEDEMRMREPEGETK